MVRFWDIEKKVPYFEMLTEQIKDKSNSAIPTLLLFEKVISDAKGRVSTNYR